MAVDGGEDIFSAAAGTASTASRQRKVQWGRRKFSQLSMEHVGAPFRTLLPSLLLSSSGQASPSLGFGKQTPRVPLVVRCSQHGSGVRGSTSTGTAPDSASNFIANSGSPSSSVSSSLLRESSALDVSNASSDGGASYHSFASSAQDQRISQHHQQQRPHQQHGISGPGKPGETLEDIIRDEGSSLIAKYARMLSVGMTLSSIEAKMERNGTRSPDDIARLSRALEESSKDAIEALREVASSSSPRPADSRSSATSPLPHRPPAPLLLLLLPCRYAIDRNSRRGGRTERNVDPPSSPSSSEVIVSSSSSSSPSSLVRIVGSETRALRGSASVGPSRIPTMWPSLTRHGREWH